MRDIRETREIREIKEMFYEKNNKQFKTKDRLDKGEKSAAGHENRRAKK